MDALNNVINMNDSDTEEVEDQDQIESLEFRTTKKTGLQIHKNKIHFKVRCNNCYREFTTIEKHTRHVEAETTLDNICDKVRQNKDFELKENLADENCLGILYTQTLRDDGYPEKSKTCLKFLVSSFLCPNSRLDLD